MIEIHNLTKAFGPLLAVDHISFSAAPGNVLGFLGPNGAGKSTTMKMVTGFLAPSDGQVTVLGYDVHRQPTEAKRQVGYLPEGAPNYGDMTPWQFLDFIASIRGLRGKQKQARLRWVVERMRLQEVLYQPNDTLSKGFQRRVGLAQAIIHEPPVLILDEPTDGLDPNQKHEVRLLIEEMAREKIIVISTHLLEEVSAVCDRAIIIARGRIVADATPSELEQRSEYHGAVTVQLPDYRDAAKILRSDADVSRVEIDDEAESITAFPKGGIDLLGKTEQLARQQQWSVRQIFKERGRLDDVFRSVTMEVQQ